MEPLIHFVVPFIALMLVGASFRKAMLVSLLALLPDLDVLLLVHRFISHSIVVVLSAATPLLLLVYKFKPRLYSYVFLALLALTSHLLLDVFTGCTPILWPLYSYSICIQVELFAHIGSSPRIIPSAKLLTKPISFQHFQSLDAPLFTSEGLVMSVVMLMPLLLKAFKAWQQARHNRELVSN